MKRNPMIALVPSVAEWFRDVGISQSASAGRYATVAQQITHDIEMLKETFEEASEIYVSDIVFESHQIDGIVSEIREKAPDILFLCQMMWTEDPAILKLVEALPDIPVALWCHYPQGASSQHMSMPELFARSATVGAFQIANAIQRIRPDVQLLIGNSQVELTRTTAQQIARAALVRRKLQEAHFALVPAPYPGMSDLVDDTKAVEEILGCTIQHRSIAEFCEIAQRVTDDKIEGYVGSLGSFSRREVNDDQILRGARATLGLSQATQEWRVDGIALDDLHTDLHTVLGTRPCLTPQGFFENGAVYGAEGDLLQTIACFAFGALIQQPTMFVEIFHADPYENHLVFGHAGIHDIRIADPATITLVPDYEYECSPSNGAWMEFTPLPGAATLAQMILTADGLRLLIAEGEILPIRHKVEGFPSGVMDLDATADSFVKWAFAARTTHHWVCMHGHQADCIERFGKIIGAEVLRFSQPQT